MSISPLLASVLEDQVDEVMPPVCPRGLRARNLAYLSDADEALRIEKERARLNEHMRSLGRLYREEVVTEEEYERGKREIGDLPEPGA